jgi:hypothetical protein
VLGVAVLAGAVTTLAVGVPLGLVAAVATGVSLRWRRARGVVRLLPAVILLGIAIYVTSGQWRHSYPPNFDWPLFFDRARNFAWLAVILTGINVAVSWVLTRRARQVG